MSLIYLSELVQKSWLNFNKIIVKKTIRYANFDLVYQTRLK